MKEQNQTTGEPVRAENILPSQLTDGHSLKGAKSRFGYAIKTYDNGYGPLWIHRDSLGISGIVRARSWEDAYSICEDEFFPEADETIDELVKEYGFRRRRFKIGRTPDGLLREIVSADYPLDPKKIDFVSWSLEETHDPEAWPDNELFQEAFGFRPNGPNKHDKLNHAIYAKDLNGDYLDRLTDRLAAELEITLAVELNP